MNDVTLGLAVLALCKKFMKTHPSLSQWERILIGKLIDDLIQYIDNRDEVRTLVQEDLQ